MNSRELCSDDKSSDKEKQEPLQVSRPPQIIHTLNRNDYFKPTFQAKSGTGTSHQILPATVLSLNQGEARPQKVQNVLQKITVSNSSMGNTESQRGPGTTGMSNMVRAQMTSPAHMTPRHPGLASNVTNSTVGQQVSIITGRPNPQVSQPGVTFSQMPPRAFVMPRTAGMSTAMIRPQTTGQSGHPVIQPRIPSIISPVRPSTPPVTRTGSPVLMHDNRSKTQQTTSTTVQITIQPPKSTMEVTPRTLSTQAHMKTVPPLSQAHQVLISQPAIPNVSKQGVTQVSVHNASLVSANTSTPSVSTCIPVAKVPPTRQQIPQHHLSEFMSSVRMDSTSGGSMLVPNHQGSPNTSSNAVLNLSTSNADVRPDMRPNIPIGFQSQFYSPELIGLNYMQQQQYMAARLAFRPGFPSQSNLAAQLQAAAHGATPNFQLPTQGTTVVVDPRKLPTVHNQYGSSEGMSTMANQANRNTSTPPSQTGSQQTNPCASPRPSILRKRTNDGLVVVRKPNFTAIDAGSPQSGSRSNTNSPKPASSMVSLDLSTRPENNGHSSTDTAPSTENNSPSESTTPLDNKIKAELEATTPVENGQTLASSLAGVLEPGSCESSPRKKPRKQLLHVSEHVKDHSSSDEDTTEVKTKKLFAKMIKKEEANEAEEEKPVIKEDYVDEDGVKWVAMRKRNNSSLINSYHCTWKSRNNHFQRYTDVKQKDERRATVNELSNQKGITQKASGWRLYHLAAQLEGMIELENIVKGKMEKIQKTLAPKPSVISTEEEVVKIQEFTQGNKQRCKLIIDQLSEVRTSMLKILDHKPKITEIINKHHSKRPVKKKDRS